MRPVLFGIGAGPGIGLSPNEASATTVGEREASSAATEGASCHVLPRSSAYVKRSLYMHSLKSSLKVVSELAFHVIR